MAVFGKPEGCGNELGKPSLGGDSRRIMHPNQGQYPGVGAPIGALLSYTRTAYGHSSALEYRRTRTKHCPKGPDTKGGLWGSWPLQLRCAMAVFGNPEGCGNERGKPSLGGDSRRIMHPNQGRYPGVGAPIMGGDHMDLRNPAIKAPENGSRR